MSKENKPMWQSGKSEGMSMWQQIKEGGNKIDWPLPPPEHKTLKDLFEDAASIPPARPMPCTCDKATYDLLTADKQVITNWKSMKTRNRTGLGVTVAPLR